jgi:hypothetical protein
MSTKAKTLAELVNNYIDQSIQVGAIATALNSRATDAQLRDKATHTGNDPASKVLFNDGTTVEAWKALITAQISGAASAPSITTAPGVPTGTLTVSSTLTKGANGTIVNGSGGAPTHLIQWNRVNLTNVSTPIPGYEMSATTPTTYILTAADVGYYISWSQQEKDPVNGLLSNVMTSAVTAIITGTAPANTGAPALSPSGTQAAGTVITASGDTWSITVTKGYLFYDNGVPIGTRSATNTTTLTSAQAGHAITVDVIGTSTLGVPSATATAGSNTVTVAGTNTVANTVLPTITRANGEGAGVIYKGFTYPIVAGTWTLNGNATTPTARQWDFYKNGVYYASNSTASFNVDVNYALTNTFQLVETVVIGGQSYSSSLAAATSYTVNAAPATLTVQVNTASSTFTSGASITPYVPVTATGGTTPYSYSINPALPGTLALNASTGQITGTANTVSNTTYTISVRDSAGSPATVTGNTTIIIQNAQSIAIAASLDASTSFASQSGTLQFDSVTPTIASVSDSPGSGFTGGMGTTVNGNATRFGKFADPLGGGFTTIRHALQVGDPDWFGSGPHRMDAVLGGANSFTQGDTAWFAINAMIPSAIFGQSDTTFLLFELHGATDGGFYVQALGTGANALVLQVIQNSLSSYVNYPIASGAGITLAGNVYYKYVVRIKLDATGTASRTQMWANGTQLVNTTVINCSNGGASNTFPAYFKTACYDGAGSTRTGGLWWHYTKAVVVQDNAGIYTEPDIRALLT